MKMQRIANPLQGFLVFVNSLMNSWKRVAEISQPAQFRCIRVVERVDECLSTLKMGLLYVAFSSTFKRLIKLRIFLISVGQELLSNRIS